MSCPKCGAKLDYVLTGHVEFWGGTVELFGDKLKFDENDCEESTRWYKCPECKTPLSGKEGSEPQYCILNILEV